jgi:hypothetical protein
MTAKTRRLTLLFLLLAAASIILLALALPRLELKPGIPLPSMQSGPAVASDEQPPPFVAIQVSSFFKILVALLVSALIVFGAFKLLRKISWKTFLRGLVIVAAVSAVVLLILLALLNISITTVPEASELPTPLPVIPGPPLAPVPLNLIWLVWAALVGVVILLAVWVIRWRSRKLSAQAQLSLEAERARQALLNGQDFRSVILNCYWQMSVVVQKEKGIARPEAMTASEFERKLEAKGFPHTPIQQLTRLFEIARYSTRQPNPQEEQAALACLNAIVEFTPSGKQAR